MDDDVKTWQWIATLGVTVILSIAGSLWSVGAMRADDMQRVRATEIEIISLRATDNEMKTSLARIESKVDDLRDRIRR